MCGGCDQARVSNLQARAKPQDTGGGTLPFHIANIGSPGTGQRPARLPQAGPNNRLVRHEVV